VWWPYNGGGCVVVVVVVVVVVIRSTQATSGVAGPANVG